MSGIVHIDFRKWPDRRHWQFAMRRLGEDQYGTWLWSPPGTVFQRGHEPPRSSSAINVKLITPAAWWTAIWSDRHPVELYVDIATPAQWDDDRVTLVDLDLDVALRRDGTVEILDEDEFDDHRVRYAYPPHVVDRARATTAAVYLDVEARREPFGDVARDWLAAATELAVATGPAGSHTEPPGSLA